MAKLAAAQAAFLQAKLQSHAYPQLRQEPHLGPNIRKLHGYRPTTWLFRIGRYRLFYLVDEERHVVFMLTVDDRRDAYRGK